GATSRQPLGHGAALCAPNGPEGSGPRFFFQVVVSHQTSVDVARVTSRQPVGHGATLRVRNGPESFGPLSLCCTGGWIRDGSTPELLSINSPFNRYSSASTRRSPVLSVIAMPSAMASST